MNFDEIRPKRRTDLMIVPRHSDASTTWVVKDPISLEYFIFDEFQYWLFSHLDGQRSLATIVEQFNHCFAPIRSTAEDVIGFCMQLSRDSLLNEVATGEVMYQRVASKRRGRLWRLAFGVLSLRFPPINARYAFNIAEVLLSWLFTPVAAILVFLFGAFALVVLSQNFNHFVAELPFLGAIQFTDLLTFLLALSAVKILHEIGHAVCCRRMGAECHEMGLMFLVGSPCLYCNVTDSWTLGNRWKRIGVVLAGIYIEILIASVAIILWSTCTEPLLRSFFLNIVLICSVGTLAINGNPLMRYDGYFALSDLVNIPNLSNESRFATWRLCSRLLFDQPSLANRDQSGSRVVFLVTYYVLSLLYRAFVLAAIFWFVYGQAKAFGVESLAIAFALSYGAVLLTGFALGLTRFLWTAARRGSVRWFGWLLFLTCVVGGTYLVAQVKVPRHVPATATIEFKRYTYCRAPETGTILDAVAYGTEITEGEPLVSIENPDLKAHARQLKHQRSLVEIQLSTIDKTDVFDPLSQFDRPELVARREQLNVQIAEVQDAIDNLTLRAPCTGTVVPLDSRARAQLQPEDAQPARHILDEDYRGSRVERGQLLCLVGDPSAFSVSLAIDERKLDLLSEGNPVELLFQAQPQRTYLGTISEFSTDATADDDRLGQLAPKTVKATVKLNEPLDFGFHGSVGKAKVQIANETTGVILRRMLTETFQWRM